MSFTSGSRSSRSMLKEWRRTFYAGASRILGWDHPTVYAEAWDETSVADIDGCSAISVTGRPDGGSTPPDLRVRRALGGK
jgi:hypothetical protein